MKKRDRDNFYMDQGGERTLLTIIVVVSNDIDCSQCSVLSHTKPVLLSKDNTRVILGGMSKMTNSADDAYQ